MESTSPAPPSLSEFLAVAIQAAPRPRSLLDESIQSFRRAGFDMPITLFAEPRTQVRFYRDVHYRFNRQRLGAFPNWRQAATHLLKHTTAPWLMLLQDDIVWHSAAAQVLHSALQHFNPQRVGFLSPYTSAAMVPSFAKQNADIFHWVEAQFSNNAFIGAQALCFPRVTLKRILEHPDFLQHAHSRKIDVLIGNLVRKRLELPIRIHVPSLVEHAGWNCSTIGRDRISGIQWSRRAFHYKGTA